MSTYRDFPGYPTQPGYYCIVFDVMNHITGEISPDFGPILRLEVHDDGDAWFEEDGTQVESLFDCNLQMQVSMKAADFYVPQS